MDSHQQLNRRNLGQATVGSLLTFSLLESLFAADAFADEVKPITAEWLLKLNELGKDVQGETITPVQWQAKTEELFAKVNLPDLLKFIDYKKLTEHAQFKKKGEKSYRPKFPEVEGLPTRLVFGHQVFALKKGRSVVPHGHNNMATAFLILDGEFEGKHYDRVESHDDHFIIKPTIDDKFTVGGCSTVSDHKDNIHWFKATSETGFIFNIHVLNIEEGVRSGRVYVDPDGQKLKDGLIRAKKLGYAEAYKKYG